MILKAGSPFRDRFGVHPERLFAASKPFPSQAYRAARRGVMCQETSRQNGFSGEGGSVSCTTPEGLLPAKAVDNRWEGVIIHSQIRGSADHKTLGSGVHAPGNLPLNSVTVAPSVLRPLASCMPMKTVSF